LTGIAEPFILPSTGDGRRVIVRLAGLLSVALGIMAGEDATVPYPVQYRKWAVTRSLVAGPESPAAGFHHYYANDKALEGFTTGKFPDGSVIVDERLEVDHRKADSFEGKRISVSVMTKDGRRYAETGGWGFDMALGDSQALAAAAETRGACYSCHLKQREHDFVFSAFRK
jgi:hypothetical protein